MKILAIIPAAEGLAMLPNRNMRVLNGKPLIYYAINNAKKSKYIDDIIVTSNNDEVLTIAEQIGGVKCYRRSEKMSGTDIAIEEVVNDVRCIIDFNEYDYIITMQSISVTLKFNTLDMAIEECLKSEIDTMISVTEKKNYFWEKNFDSFVCHQTERVAKENICPLYMETGAFFIARPKYINSKTRIGGKTRLFFLSKDESVDVKSFGELREAEFILTKKKIAFYVNGNEIIGMGHIKRVVMLADEFFVKPTIFFDKNVTKRNFFGDISYDLIGVDGKGELVEKLQEGSYELLINDVLSTSEEFMDYIRKTIPDIKIVNLEDEGKGSRYADLVINALYDKADFENQKVGPDYYIAPKLFLLQEKIKVLPQIRNVLVTFGGADPQNYTEQVLEIIDNKEYDGYFFNVVIGPANQRNIKVNKKNITIHRNINSLVDLMRKSDLAICSRGRTGFELAICGIPSICMAQNEREERHGFMCDENGFTYLGYQPSVQSIKEALDKMLMTTELERIALQEKMQRHNLKSGRKNIIDLINYM